MRLFLALPVLALFTACGGSGEESTNASTSSTTSSSAASSSGNAGEGEVLVSVENVNITVAEFQAAAARKMPANGEKLSLDEKKEILDKLVADRLLYLNGLELGIDKDPKVQKVVVNTLLRDVVYSEVSNEDFPEDVLRTYYEANREDYVIQAKVQIRRILVVENEDRDAAAAKAEAGRLHAEVVASPERFREVAAKFSDGSFKRRGGDMGFVPKSGKPGVDQLLVDKAFSMETNEISSVFKTDEGFNILMVAKKRERHDRTFQQVRGAVLRKLKTDKMTELLDAYVATLQTQTSVSVDDSVLDAIAVELGQRPGSRLDAAPNLSPQGGHRGEGKGLRGLRMPQANPNGTE